MSENEKPGQVLTWKDVNQATRRMVSEIPFEGDEVRTARVQRAVFLLTGQTVEEVKIRECKQSMMQNHIWAVLHQLYPDVYRHPKQESIQ